MLFTAVENICAFYWCCTSFRLSVATTWRDLGLSVSSCQTRSSADLSAAMASSPATTPKTRQGLSLSERIKVIEARQMGKSMRQLAAQFHCGKTQILNTLAQKERYLHEWHLLGGCNNPSMGARKRFRHTRNEQINSSVHEWYHQQKSLGVRITGPMLQHQARHTATQLGIANFAASNGWLANFRRFYNIVNR